MSREAARDPRLFRVWVSAVWAPVLVRCFCLAGCVRKPLRVGAGTTVVLTVGIALPLSTDCTDCTARDYGAIWGATFVGSALVGTLVAYVLAEDEDDEPKPKPDKEKVTFYENHPTRRPSRTDEHGKPLANLPGGPTRNQACAAAKHDVIEHIAAECERVAVGIAAAPAILDDCECTQTDDGFACTAPVEETCARDVDPKIGLGVAAAGLESNARDRAKGAAAAMCVYGHGSKVRDVECSCDQADCICTVIAECEP